MTEVNEQLAALSDGYFYHSIDLPGLPTIAGAWDLRPAVDSYLGGIDVAGKRVLEVGAANGFLSFHMERQGASVVPYDLSPDRLGDIMLFPGLDKGVFEAKYREVVTGLNRAWWHAQRAFGSSLALRHGTAYEIPEELGPVDITTFGSILLHLRDPYSALAAVARLTRERIVVTDLLNAPFCAEVSLERSTAMPARNEAQQAQSTGMIFNPTRNQDPSAWWSFSPGAIERLLLAVGFGRSRVTFHQQLFRPGFAPWGPAALDSFKGCTEPAPLFTVVAERL
jgi:SAM-dependent methyltransferase